MRRMNYWVGSSGVRRCTAASHARTRLRHFTLIERFESFHGSLLLQERGTATGYQMKSRLLGRDRPGRQVDGWQTLTSMRGGRDDVGTWGPEDT